MTRLGITIPIRPFSRTAKAANTKKAHMAERRLSPGGSRVPSKKEINAQVSRADKPISRSATRLIA